MTILCSRNVWKFHAELHEALGDSLLPERTVPRWIWVLKSGKVSTSDMHHSGCSFHIDMSVGIIEQCMDGDKHWTAKELPEHTGICGPTVLWILWQHLKMHEIVANWVPCHLNEVQIGHAMRNVVESGTVLLWRGQHVISDNCNQWSVDTRAYEQELKWQSSKCCHPVTMKIQGVTNYITHEADGHFGIWCQRCSCVSFCSTVRWWVHSITSYFCHTTYVVYLRRCIQNWLKIWSYYVIMLQCTKQTRLRAFSSTEGGKCTTLSLSPYSLSLSLCHCDSQNESTIVLEMICREDILNSRMAWGGTD